MTVMRYTVSVTAAVCLLAFSLASCAGHAVTARRGGPTMAQMLAERYDGPKARLAVVRFVDKTGKGAGVGEGLADMLMSELFRTNRFIMLDRQDLGDVISEQDLGASGRVSGETAVRIGQIEGADLLVFGAVTAFEPDHIGAGGIIMGAVTLGATLAIASQNKDAPIGAVLYKESYVAIDIKIVETATGRVVAMTAAEGRYYDMGGGVIGGVGGGASRVPVMLGGFAGSGAEQAVRVCITRAVENIVGVTPAEYYRVKDTLDMTPAGLIAPTYPVNFPEASAAGVTPREARVIDSPGGYDKLLSDLHVESPVVPVFDWSRDRLVAVFAGEKPVKGHRVGVVKAIHRKDHLEVIAREAAPADLAAAEQAPDWPFEVVRLDNPGKPIKVTWEN